MLDDIRSVCWVVLCIGFGWSFFTNGRLTEPYMVAAATITSLVGLACFFFSPEGGWENLFDVATGAMLAVGMSFHLYCRKRYEAEAELHRRYIAAIEAEIERRKTRHPDQVWRIEL